MKKTRILTAIFALLLALGVYTLAAPEALAVEAAGTCGTNLAYVLTDSGNLYVLGTGTMDNYSTSSPAPWYDYASQIYEVQISDEINSIGDYAFYGCYNLTTITGAGGVSNIGSHAFDGCSSLGNMPSGASSIGSYAFRNCSSLTSGYVSGSSLGEGVFYGCSSLSSVSLSGSMSRVPAYTFYDCYRLTSVNLPSSLSSIGESAFDGAGLYSVSLPSGITELGAKAFRRTNLTAFTLPSKMTEVPDRLLSRCSNLESLTLHEGVTRIYDNAFYGCSSLMGVDLPESLQEIGEGAFSSCSSLAVLNLKQNVKTIPVSGFADCTGLTFVEIPSTVETVSDEAFKGCTSLAAVTISEGVTTLGNSVFADCEALNAVTLPTSIKTIGSGVFSGCTALTQVRYAGYLARWTKVEVGEDNDLLSLEKIGIDYLDGGNLGGGNVWSVSAEGVLNISGSGDLENFEQGSAPWRGHSSEINQVVIDSRIKNLGAFSFEGLDRITEITLPKGVTRISQGMFKDCVNLVTVTGMDRVKNIGDSAFENCVSLAIDIPTVITLGNRAFAGCKTLGNIILNCETIGDGAFENCTGLKKIIIRNNVKNIGENAFAGCDPDLANFVGNQEELKALNVGPGNETLTNVLDIYYYIKNIYLGAGANKKAAEASIADKTYHTLGVNLNSGGDGYVCIGYSLTNDIDEALTDIRLYTTTKSQPEASMVFNGMTYFLLSQPVSTDSQGNSLYICTTKDQTAGDPIFMIGLTYGEKSTFTMSDNWHLSTTIVGKEMSLNSGDQDVRLYFTSDMNADYGEPIGGNALYVAVAAICVTLIAGAGILLFLRRRTKKDEIPAENGEAAETVTREVTEPEEAPAEEAPKEEAPPEEAPKEEAELPSEEPDDGLDDDLFDIYIPENMDELGIVEPQEGIEDDQKTPGELLAGLGARLKNAVKREKPAEGGETELDEEPVSFKEKAKAVGEKIKLFFKNLRDGIVIGIGKLKAAVRDRKAIRNSVKQSAQSAPKPTQTKKKSKSGSAKDSQKPKVKSNSEWDKRQAYNEKKARKAKAKKELERKKAQAARQAAAAKKDDKTKKEKVKSGK